MIRLEHVDKYFNRFKKNQIHVINDTSLELPSTGLVALLGPSGSGKTTLLNAIGGLDKVRKGNIYINGKKITKRTQKRVDKIRNLNIGYIFQDYKLIENMSVYDNVALVLKMLGIKDKKEIDKRVCYVLDKVKMLRYKKRPCNMLSGGERQRVGIARAIVKNPNIIIADEPTGNLDSKNTIEIMNIIKAISKDKLVILVTHENNLAKFYASRIIEIEDGKIIKDYENENENDLDYETSNTLYLKDYKEMKEYSGIKVYSDDKVNVKLNIVVTNNNIYIESLSNQKIEVIDDTSSMEMVDAHHKNISKEDIDSYQFDYDKIINNPKKLKYASIFNPITFITNGFKKVLDYSLLKKALLIGFFLSGIFIQYSTSNILTSLTIKDENFVNIQKKYLTIEAKKLKLEEYLELENNLEANYIIPTDSNIYFNIINEDFYQTSQQAINANGSLSSTKMLNKNSLLVGRLPENDKEVVIDKMIVDKQKKQEFPKMIGLFKNEDYLNKTISIKGLESYKIVGIVNEQSPSIYVDENQMINMLYHSKDSENNYDTPIMNLAYVEEDNQTFDDYNLYLNKISLIKGNLPVNDYETIINKNYQEQYKIGKECDKKINGRKLIVVGYYESKDSIETYLVNPNMIKTKLILTSSNISVYPKNKEKSLQIGREKYHLNINDSYQSSKQKYIKDQKDSIKASLISAGIILIISLVEILLMIRSSFLSRIKEVGIYRAIGVKKKDIYIMFSGEIIAITVLASIPGILICAYILKQITNISILEDAFIINPFIVILSILLVLAFNLIVGLIPVFNTIRKRPASILARTDI